MSLATILLAKKTTFVGTIKENKRDLPKAAKQIKDNILTVLNCLISIKNFCPYNIQNNKRIKELLFLALVINLWKSIEVIKKMLPDSAQFTTKQNL